MTRRILLPLSAFFLLSACADPGLTAQGLVTVTAPGPTVRTFELPSQTRLDGSGVGRFTGTCRLLRTMDDAGNEQWGATVDIHSGGTNPGDVSPLTRFTVMQNSGAALEAGRVEIELGGLAYSPVDGECSISMPYALGDGVVGLEGSCSVVSASGDTADVELELDVTGCSVER